MIPPGVVHENRSSDAALTASPFDRRNPVEADQNSERDGKRNGVSIERNVASGAILFIRHGATSRELKLERRAGIEPANTGFADLRVCHFATGASFNIRTLNRVQNEKPTEPCGGWVVGIAGFRLESSPKYTPAHGRSDSSKDKQRDS